MIKIVIDPGHGGSDPGATYKKNYEKQFTMDIALATVRYLEKKHVAKLYLTRDDDISVSLQERASFANKLNADLFISIHINAGGGTGFESFIYTQTGSETKQIQKSIHQKVAGYFKSLGFSDRGIKSANFSVLRNTAMSAVLLENLFIDNSKDLAQLTKHGFTKQLGEVIGKAIASAMQLPVKSQPATEPPAPSPKPNPEPSPLPEQNAWDPQAEIERLRQDGLVNNRYSPGDPVTWGQFATVLNRLRDRL